MTTEINEKKIREAFRMFKSGELENNIRDHRFAVWGLTTSEYGGGFYLVGNKRTIELWTCEGFSSRVADGSRLSSVPNNAEGYAELAHVFDQYITA